MRYEERNMEKRETHQWYLKMSLFRSDFHNRDFSGSKIFLKYFKRHILRSQAYSWIGIRKIWVFSKQNSMVDERVKVRIFKLNK